jgi:DNA-binding NarL/FixJ family response regulator
MNTLKIILVDDNEAFRKALKMLLENQYHATVIGDVSNATDFLKLNYQNADIIFMDIMMPEVDGIKLAKETLWNHNELKLIAITMHTEKVYLTSLVEAGFKGCIFKNNLFQELPIAIETVLNGRFYFPSKISINED